MTQPTQPQDEFEKRASNCIETEFETWEFNSDKDELQLHQSCMRIANFGRNFEREKSAKERIELDVRRQTMGGMSGRITELEAELADAKSAVASYWDRTQLHANELASLKRENGELRMALQNIQNIQNTDWPDRIFAAQEIARKALKPQTEGG